MAGLEITPPDGKAPDEKAPLPGTKTNTADREYDRRGVLLPARAKVGGIITPQ